MRCAIIAACVAIFAIAQASAAEPVPPQASAAPAAQSSAPTPQYAAERCCSLCPRAADASAYAGSQYLSDFRVLLDGRDGWLFRSEMDLTTSFDITDESLHELHRLSEALHRRGTELVLVYQPPRGLMDPDKLKPEQRKSYDFPTARRNYSASLDKLRSGGGVIVAPLDTLVDENKGYEYFFRRDHHWTPAGAEHSAKVVAETVRKLPAFASIPHKEFTTHQIGVLAKPGTLQKIAAQLCGGGYSMQYVSMFATEGSGGDGGGGLLGDEAQPEVALVGTSNSDAKGGYNFGGYLEQYLGADIVNVAISGGAFEGSLLHYLQSKEFQQHPPKVIVWEMPYQNYPSAEKNPHKIFRQAVPLVADGCRGKPSLLSSTITAHPGSNELLFNGGGRILPLVGRDAQLDFQFSDPAEKDLHAELWYFNGLKESLKLHFNQYVDNGGRFVAELRTDRPDYASATLMGATLEVDPVYVVSASVTPLGAAGAKPTGGVSISNGETSCSFTLPATSCNLSGPAPTAASLTATYTGDANFSNATSAGSPASGPAAAVRVAITDIKPANAESAPAKPLTLTAQLCSRESSAAASVAAK
jgi:alginate biosynthesis protein AlgX